MLDLKKKNSATSPPPPADSSRDLMASDLSSSAVKTLAEELEDVMQELKRRGADSALLRKFEASISPNNEPDSEIGEVTQKQRREGSEEGGTRERGTVSGKQ